MFQVFDNFERQQENEFQVKCRELADIRQSQAERYTIDDEWSEEELKSNVYDVCVEVMTDRLLKKYEHKALYNTNLLNHQYMTDHILNQIGDVVEFYNDKYNSCHGDVIFKIVLFDNAIKSIILNDLRENVVLR